MMKRMLVGTLLVLTAAGCTLSPRVTDGPDREDRDRPPVTAPTTTTTGEVNCQALGCPGSPPAT